MSTYDFEPNPEDYGPEPAHIANGQKVKAKIPLPPLPSPQVSYAKCSWAYTAEQMQAHYQKGRADALLDAQKATTTFGQTGAVIAAAIGALK